MKELPREVFAAMKPGAQALPPAAITALHAGDRIGAIRIVREAQGIGLKDAKDAVDAAIAMQPGLKLAFEQHAGSHGRGLVRLIVFVAIVFVAWFVLLPR